MNLPIIMNFEKVILSVAVFIQIESKTIVMKIMLKCTFGNKLSAVQKKNSNPLWLNEVKRVSI